MYMTKPMADLFEFPKKTLLQPLLKDSVVDNREFRSYISEMLGDREFQRGLSFIATDLISGQPVVFDETISNEERVDALIASTSIPMIFPPKDIDNYSFADGAVFSTVSLGDLIARCREDGVESDEDIIVDILLCYRSEHKTEEWSLRRTSLLNTWNFYQRRKTISSMHFVSEDVKRVLHGFKDITLRHILQPSQPLESPMVPKDATLEDLQREFDLGYSDGATHMADFLEPQSLW